MASLLINLFYSCQSFGRHTPAVLSPTAVIQVKMLTRGVVAVELQREKSFPRWRLARNIGWGCGGLKILPHWLGWVCEKTPELYCRLDKYFIKNEQNQCKFWYHRRLLLLSQPPSPALRLLLLKKFGSKSLNYHWNISKNCIWDNMGVEGPR